MMHKLGITIFMSVFAFLAVQAQVVADFEAVDTEGCNLLVLELVNLSTGADTYAWVVENEAGEIVATSSLANPTFFLILPGTYTVTLTATGPGGSDVLTLTDYVNVYSGPDADLLVDPIAGCSPLEITATDISTPGTIGSISEFYWVITGAGTLPSTPEINYTFLEDGVYTVFLFVEDDAGCTDFDEVDVTVTETPDAGFVSDTAIACEVPLTVAFTDTTPDVGTFDYFWDFGDGSTSTEVNPTHSYTTSGSFDVMLVVTNDFGCSDTMLIEDYIQINSTIPLDFTVSDANICVGNSVSFDNLSGSDDADWLWDFGDGTTSTEFEPSHTYTEPGVYTVSLEAVFGGGCEGAIEYTALIEVLDIPEFFFTASDSSSVCELPLVVTFDAEADGPVESVMWEFEYSGGVDTSFLPNPTFSWDTEGDWNVTLTVTNTSGCSNTITSVDMISIGQLTAVPLADFTAGCIPMDVTFSATADEEIISWEWDLGDGTTSTDSTPSVTYDEAGCYDIGLIIESVNGCTDTVTYFEYVCAGVPGAADFIVFPDTSCLGTPIEVGFLPLDSIVAEIDGTGLYSSTDDVDSISVINLPPGDNELVVVVWNFGCPDTLTASVHVLDVTDSLNVIIQDCDDPLTVQLFLDTALAAISCGWEWDFGDGTTDTINMDPIHTFDSAGLYTATITYFCITPEPCTGTGMPLVVTEPLAMFEIPPAVCDTPYIIDFVNTSTDGVSTTLDYVWDFGDGTTDTLENPSHTFPDVGEYTVTLTMTDSNSCMDDVAETIYISQLNAGFIADPPGGCTPFEFAVTDTSNSLFGNITSWIFDWDDGTIDTFTTAGELAGLTHLYDVADYYYVTLTVEDDLGCISVFEDTILASFPTVDFTANDTIPCLGHIVEFTELATGVGVTYLWDFGDGTTSTSANPDHVYTVEGVFDVTLTVTDVNGCVATLTKPAYMTTDTVLIDFDVDILVASCNYALVQFSSESDDSICTYLWDFGDGSTSGGEDPLYPYLEAGSYDISLTVTSCNGCEATIVKEDYVLVPGPYGDLAPVEDTACVGNTVELEFSVASSDTATVFFDNGDVGYLDIDYSDELDTIYIPYTYDESGVYEVSVLLVDTNGCFNIIESSGELWVGNVPEALYTITDTILCVGDPLVFDDGSTGEDPIINWLWDTGDSTFTDTLSNSYDYSYDEPGDYLSQLIVETSFGCADTIDQGITVLPYPEGSTTPDTTICPGFGVLLNAEGGIEYSWTPPDGLSNPSIPNPVASPDVTTTYFVNVSNGYCAATDSITITVIDDLNLEAGPDTVLCFTDEIQLFAELTDEVEFSLITFEWTPSDFLSSTTILDPVSTTNESIIYFLTATCGELEDNDFAEITVLPPPDVEITEDTIIMIQDQVIGIESEILQSSGTVSYEWQPGGAVDCPTCPSVTVSPDVTTLYSVELTDGSGCSDVDFVIVKVIPCDESILEIPNIITPNGDGMNDVFRIQYEGISEIRVIRIFNRWGELMFQTENIDEAWDGTFNGVVCNPGVYVYMIEAVCVNGADNIIYGNITLVK